MVDPFSGKRAVLKGILDSTDKLVDESEDFRADHVIRFQKSNKCLDIRLASGVIHRFDVSFEKEEGFLQLTGSQGPKKFELSAFGECHIKLPGWERDCVFPLSAMATN